MPEHPRDTDIPERPARGHWRWLLVLTFLGLMARVAFLILEPPVELMGDEPTWRVLGVRGLAKLKRPLSPFESRIIFYPPAYPYFMAVPFLLFGSLEAVKWAQAVLGSLLIPAVGRAGFLAYSPREGLLAAGLAAFYPDLIWYSVHFWSETLFLVLLWWAVERILAAEAFGSRAAAALGGLFWGLAVLTRETALYFTPVVALWLAWGRRKTVRSREAPQRHGSRRAQGAIFLLASLLTVAPWTYRNWVVFQAFVPVSTFGAFNLWQGNSRLPREELLRLSNSVEGPIAQEALALRMALQDIWERQPTWLLEKIGSELPALWLPESQALVHLEQGAYGATSSSVRAAVKLVCVLPYLAVLALFIWGLPTLSTSRAGWFFLSFLVYYNVIHVLTFGSDRFRLPLMPLLMLVAARTACKRFAERR